jgi:hypothetical protein
MLHDSPFWMRLCNLHQLGPVRMQGLALATDFSL